MNKFSRIILLSVLPFTLLSGQACSNQDSDQVSVNGLQWLKVTNVSSDDSLNLRSEPSRLSSIVSVIPYDEHNIVKLEQKNDWIRVSSNGLQGWVHSKYVQKSNHEPVIGTFGKELTCFGGEPHWSLSTLGETVVYGLYDEENTFFLNSKLQVGLNRNNIWHGEFTDKNLDGRKMTVLIEKNNICSDDMTDVNYPFSITVIDSNQNLLSGCCKI